MKSWNDFIQAVEHAAKLEFERHIQEAYNRGYADGMKAQAYHEELCAEEATAGEIKAEN